MVQYFFYEEDKVNYLPTVKNFQDERLSTKAVKEIETEIENEGILSADFCVEWYQNYEKLQNWCQRSLTVKLTVIKEVIDYISKLSFVVSMMKAEKLAYKYWQEFINIPIISEESIKDWLIRCDHDLHNHIYGFPHQSNFWQIVKWADLSVGYGQVHLVIEVIHSNVIQGMNQGFSINLSIEALVLFPIFTFVD